jgi:predicted  nucleic acid-binding Zn-ribbon protein
MSETMKIILTMVTVGIALAALIINSNGNIRADMRDIRVEIRANSAEIHDVRTEVADVRTEMAKFGQALQTLTSRVTRLEELIQKFFLSRQDAVAKTGQKGKIQR